MELVTATTVCTPRLSLTIERRRSPARWLLSGARLATSLRHMTKPSVALKTKFGKMLCGDSLSYMKDGVEDESLNLIFTSPPFALVRKKEYGNEDEEKTE